MAESTRKGGPPRWVIRASAPIAMAISGRRWFPLFAVIHHRGRRSGTAYSTPIAVVPTQSKELFLLAKAASELLSDANATIPRLRPAL